MTNKDSTNNLAAHLRDVAFPALHDVLDRAFPEFGWKRTASGWEATNWPDGVPRQSNRKRADRLNAYRDNPWGVVVHGKEAFSWVEYITGQRSPRGEVFVDAVRRLSELAGVEFPKRALSPDEFTRLEKRKRRGSILGEVFKWTASQLLAKTDEAKEARDYLGGRGIEEQHFEELGLGFYANASDLRQHLLGQGFTAEDIKDEGVVFDRMEGHVVFCWRDEHGRPLTLYGRHPNPPEDAPKNMGLPGAGTKRSPLFLNLAKDRQPGKALDLVVVEGLFDAAVLQLKGEHRAVASSSKTLSTEQLDTIERAQPRRVYVVGDPDKGGEEGNIRNARALRDRGIASFVVPTIPNGSDPDEFVLAQGVEDWRDLVDNSTTAARFLALNVVEGITPASSDADKEEALRRCLEVAEAASGPFALRDAEDVFNVASNATGYSPEAIADVDRRVGEQRRADRLRRESASAIKSAAMDIENNPEKAEEVSTQLSKRLLDVASSNQRLQLVSFAEAIKNISTESIGLLGGFGDLDESVRFRPGTLNLVGGRTGHGKTSVLAHLLHRWSEEEPVVFISMEERGEDILLRLISRLAYAKGAGDFWTTISVARYLREPDGVFKGDTDLVDEAKEEVERRMRFLRLVYAPHLDADQIGPAIHSLVGEGGPASAVLVDYLQKIPPGKTQADRRDIQVSHAARALKIAAVECGVPVVAGVQINRESIPADFRSKLKKAEEDPIEDSPSVAKAIQTSRPMLHHLREGGSEQEADVVLGLLNHAAESDLGQEFEVGVLKNRRGQTGKWVSLRFSPGHSLIDGGSGMPDPRDPVDESASFSDVDPLLLKGTRISAERPDPDDELVDF